MKKKLLASLIMASSAVFLTACGSDNKDDNTSPSVPNPNEPVEQTPNDSLKPSAVQNVLVLDVNNYALGGATVQILADSDWKANQPKGKMLSTSAASTTEDNLFFQENALPTELDFKGTSYLTNEKGITKISDLKPGTYYALVSILGKKTITAFIIHNENTHQQMVLNIALSCTSVECTDVNHINDAVIGTLSGQVIANGKPLANAQVSLSGGADTNGAFVTALTDKDGYYTLSYNVSDKLIEALQNAKLTIFAEGYQTLVYSVFITSSVSTGSQNILVDEEKNSTLVWRETFENDSTTRSLWVVEYAVGEQKNENIAPANKVVFDGIDLSSKLSLVKWNLIESNHNIVNTAWNKHVYLAPNDLSLAKVIEPLQGQFSYWYGDKTTGNFIGPQKTLGQTHDQDPVVDEGATLLEETGLDGGTSEKPNSGALISPVIDLSKAKAPLSLSFKTWWEIESENPNNNGYDLMDVQVSVDGGKFKPLARLNPLSDPETAPGFSRHPIPFSNFGFNQAPAAAQQEAITLDEYVGQANVRLKFSFNTKDEFYNGFRGWMIDDIVIQNQIGTFPLFQAPSEIPEVENGNEESVPVVASVMMKSSKVLLKSAQVPSRWATQPKR